MEEWKEYRLGDVISIAGGFAYKGNLIGEGDNFLLSMGCVSFSENFLDKGARQYAGECPERFYAFPGDIVLATRQQSDNLPILGMPAIIPTKYEGHKMIVGANLYRVDIKDKSFSNRYLYWLLKTPSYVNHIRSCQSGTTVRMITKSNIEDYIFYAPDKATRDKISDFIWALDDKIELNRKINANLEAQAQALFKSWFVDFEPFKDQPFVESELGMIPEGLRVGKLGELCTFKRGKNLLTKDAIDEGVPVVAGGLEPSCYHNVSNTKSPVVTVSGSGANAGFMRMYYQEVWASDCSFIDSTCENLLFVYCFLSVNRRLLRHAQTGAVQPHVKPSDIHDFDIVIPPKRIIEEFQTKIQESIQMRGNIEKENSRLASLRDALLPRLMSGELKVNEIVL